MTIMISCARPTAGIGIKTLPPSAKVLFTALIKEDSTCCLVGCTSSLRPYVLSISNVSTLGKFQLAASNKILFPNLISPEYTKL